MRRARVLVGVLACAIGCREPTAPADRAAIDASPAPAASSVSAPRAGCTELLAELEAEVRKAPGDCSKDDDCACYQGGDPIRRCGGVANRSVAGRVTALAEDAARKKCFPSILQCAAWACNPACVDTRCQNGTQAPR